MATLATIRNRRPLANLGHRDTAYTSVDTSSDTTGQTATPIDKTRWFVHPEATALYYTPIYHQLSEDHKRRYNQLTALAFNELIATFEAGFACTLRATQRMIRHKDRELNRGIERFLADEAHHIKQWWQLNRQTEPSWYARDKPAITHIAWIVRFFLRRFASQPRLLPANFWLMLALEEHSLDLSRRCLKLDDEMGEPNYRHAYKQHAKDEIRHVHMDWHLIDRFYATLSKRWRMVNAKVLATMIRRCFLPPTHTAVRVMDRLIAEYPELAKNRQTFKRQLTALSDDPKYHAMMYSRQATPILFQLFDRFPEMHRMQHVLRSYTPPETPPPETPPPEPPRPASDPTLTPTR